MNSREDFEKEENRLNREVIYGSITDLYKNSIIRLLIKELHIEALQENKRLDSINAFREIGEIK